MIIWASVHDPFPSCHQGTLSIQILLDPGLNIPEYIVISCITVYAKTVLIGSGMRFEQLYSSKWATTWWNNACTKIFVAT